MHIYRKIYEQNYGKIPIDSQGRTFDIHHIDNNHRNNDPINLKAVTLEEHYDIHLSQGDYGACYLISIKMKMSPQKISELASKYQKERMVNGTHHWIGDKNPSKISSNNKTHHWFGKENTTKQIASGKNVLVGNNKIQKQLAKKLLSEGRHNTQIEHCCPHCNKIGKGPAMFKHHFDNCRKDNK